LPNPHLLSLTQKFLSSADQSVITLTRFAAYPKISTDYGKSWSILTLSSGAFDVQVLSDGKILLVSNMIDPSTNKRAIHIENVTTSGERNTITIFKEDDEFINAFELNMLNDEVGYCLAAKTENGASQTQVFKTTDGWKTYTYQGTISNIAPSLGTQFDFHVPTSDTLFLNIKHTSNISASSNTIYFSYDAGKTWQNQTIVPTKFDTNDKLQAMHFFNGKEFISIWEFGRIFLNKDLNGSPIINPLNILELSRPNEINIYPNPTSRFVHLKNTTNVQSIELYDLSGKRLHTITNNEIFQGIDLLDFPRGIYIMQIKTDLGMQVARVIKDER
jgi:hypothetical protein